MGNPVSGLLGRRTTSEEGNSATEENTNPIAVIFFKYLLRSCPPGPVLRVRDLVTEDLTPSP